MQMGYVLSARDAGDPTAVAERRANGAIGAIQAAAAYLREGHSARIRDDAGQRVSLGDLLEAATVQTIDTDAGRLLTVALADYVDAGLDRDLSWAAQEYEVLTSPERDRELIQAEIVGQPTADQRRSDSEERARLSELLFGAGTWRHAGEVWARAFSRPAPGPVLDELARRDPRASRDGIQLGADEWLARASGGPIEVGASLADRRRHDRLQQIDAAAPSLPAPVQVGDRPGAGRVR
jgi:hypothetical protein